MKKSIIIALSLCLVLLALVGCSAPEGEETPDVGEPDVYQFEPPPLSHESAPPVLTLESTSGGQTKSTEAVIGGYTWSWMDENGMTVTDENEAPCAADMKHIAVLDRADTDGTVTLRISEGGELRSLQVWKDKAPMEEGERLKLEGTVITLPESGAYRYELIVEYPSGKVYYAFMVTE